MAKLTNSDIDAAATFHQKFMVVRLDTLAASTTKRVAKFVLPFDIEVIGVATDTSAITGTPTVDVLAGTNSVLASAVSLVNNAGANGTLHGTRTRRKIAKNTAIVVNAITPAASTITDLTVAVTYRAIGTRGGL